MDSQPVFDLFLEAQQLQPSFPKVHSQSSNDTFKYFVEVVNNVFNIPISQLPIPCIKGDRLEIEIPKDEHLLGLDSCKHTSMVQSFGPKVHHL